MTVHEFLHDRSDVILQEATDVVISGRLSRDALAGRELVHQRLKALLVLTVRGIKERNLGPMEAHAEEIARERFLAGYELRELQAAFHVLEEVLWSTILSETPPAESGEALGLVSTVLGAGKNALACRYLSLAGKTRVPTLHLTSLFTGTGA